MKRRDFIIKSALAGAALSVQQIFPFGGIKKTNGVGNPLHFPPELQLGEPLIFNSTNVEVWPGTTTQILGLNHSYPDQPSKNRYLSKSRPDSYLRVF